MREYFYTIDSEGRLFHDQSELTDAWFLDFFFKRIASNQTGQHVDYRFVSPCGREMNYIQCLGAPIVFRHLVEEAPNIHYLNYAGKSRILLVPTKLYFDENHQLIHFIRPGIMGRLGKYSLDSISKWIQETESGYQLTYNSTTFNLKQI